MRRAILLSFAVAGLLAIAVSAGPGLMGKVDSAGAPPTVSVKVLAVPASAADPNFFVQFLPSTGAGVAMPSSGLNNVSVGAPVTVQGAVVENKDPQPTFAWTLSIPSGSKSVLGDASTPGAKWFMPDVPGIYKVDLVGTNPAGSGPMASVQIHAGEYIGVDAGGCKGCHPGRAAGWAKTPHATMFTRQIDGAADPKNSHYNEGCVRCHSTGYYIGATNGGFAAVQAETGWQFPSLDSIQSGMRNWAAAPAALKNVSNIQCEVCHGPAKDHVQKNGKMDTSLDEGVCNQCHNGGGSHVKGEMLKNAKHAEEASTAWNYPTGPSRQACVRCHSGYGYISFLENPTEQASWNNEKHTVTCAVCHDSHSDENTSQLRITGVPVQVPGVTKDFALSATCAECHNARTTAADAAKGSFPHYSAAAEMLSNVGGVEYGQDLPNSPHSLMVGAGPVPDAAGNPLFGGATPGPCVACHMWPTPADAKDPQRFKVGGHSWNMKSPDGKFDYTAACQSCHPGVAQFNFPAKADYDGNGKVEGVQTEVAGLLSVLQKAIGASGVKPVTGHPYFDRADVAKANDKQKNAIYNYLFVRGLEGADGKASAIHNFKRSVALAQSAYRDLTDKDVPNATIVK